MPRVALAKTGDRKQNILKALELIKDDIKIGGKQIIIKPNFVSTHKPLAATHADHIRGILDFFQPFYKKKFIIAESPAHTDPFKGYKNFGYTELENEYNVELIDLDDTEQQPIQILDSQSKPFDISVAKMLLDQNNYIISPAILKTHDSVVLTLSLKNIVMGAVRRGDKVRMHQGYPQMNRNLFKLANEGFVPDLAIIDGFVGMEGNGPSSGDPIEVGVAIASTDFLAADRVGVEIMGVDSSKVGYLNYCYEAGMGEYDLSKIEIIGEKLENCKKKFKLHSDVKSQYNW